MAAPMRSPGGADWVKLKKYSPMSLITFTVPPVVHLLYLHPIINSIDQIAHLKEE